MKRVLVVDDDPAVARGVEEALHQEHYEVVVAETGAKGRELASHENLDLVILDLKLPDIRGEDVLAEIRKSGNTLPVLVLSSRKEELDIVTLLEMGADDYMTKPFKVRILLAQVRALLRRHGDYPRDLEDYTFADVHVDFRKQEARRDGVPVRLSSREFRVLKFLVLHEGEVVSRDQLLNEVWGYDQFPTTRTVDNYILSLRKKLERDSSAPCHILTVHTSGYRFLSGGAPGQDLTAAASQDPGSAAAPPGGQLKKRPARASHPRPLKKPKRTGK